MAVRISLTTAAVRGQKDLIQDQLPSEVLARLGVGNCLDFFLRFD
jgi:hypothetical protein